MRDVYLLRQLVCFTLEVFLALLLLFRRRLVWSLGKEFFCGFDCSFRRPFLLSVLGLCGQFLRFGFVPRVHLLDGVKYAILLQDVPNPGLWNDLLLRCSNGEILIERWWEVDLHTRVVVIV